MELNWGRGLEPASSPHSSLEACTDCHLCDVAVCSTRVFACVRAGSARAREPLGARPNLRGRGERQGQHALGATAVAARDDEYRPAPRRRARRAAPAAACRILHKEQARHPANQLDHLVDQQPRQWSRRLTEGVATGRESFAHVWREGCLLERIEAGLRRDGSIDGHGRAERVVG
eukprot:1423246-Pleurochrysis_carterae.AAC.1